MSNTVAQAVPHPDRLQNFERNSRTLASAQPSLMQAFWGLHKAAVADGALDTKTKELMALAISVAARCDDCIAHHRRLRQGHRTEPEVFRRLQQPGSAYSNKGEIDRAVADYRKALEIDPSYSTPKNNLKRLGVTH